MMWSLIVHAHYLFPLGAILILVKLLGTELPKFCKITAVDKEIFQQSLHPATQAGRQ